MSKVWVCDWNKVSLKKPSVPVMRLKESSINPTEERKRRRKNIVKIAKHLG